MSSSPREGLVLLPLACPACGRNLDPLAEDRAFVCSGCGAGCELVNESLAARPVRFPAGTAPDPTLAPTIALPFWSLGEGILAPAFNGSRLLTLTKWYSARAAATSGDSGPSGRRLVGAALTSDEARRVAALTLGEAIETCDPVIVGVPFVVDASRFVCAITGLHIYFETLEAGRAILERAGIADQGLREI